MGEAPFGGAGKSLGATVRPEEITRRAGAMRQKSPNSNARESRALSGGCQSGIFTILTIRLT
ncbi:MAG: hypothetical protein F6K40_26145 [Okeania sp. SIO3I5]|uniref:hypothetical protein n=1 Tax=Okeania sp. SIO3I5 TaxID=2607805 RepID=UPI0013B7CEF5|nr:hypothetical protein [Okeania sp. SIO3I5]NEQ39546.1 hypothetical protein [Okeania sp. SIO3I5]